MHPPPGPLPPEDIHPLDAHSKRDPLAGAGARVIVLAGGDPGRAERIGQGLVELFTERGRAAEVAVVEDYDGRARAIERGLDGDASPLVLVTSAVEPWTGAHLDPLLKAIDHADIVLGRRKLSAPARLARHVRSWPWRWLFAVPLDDVHSPCRLHRREALEAIPLQSASAFVDVETLAKATFFRRILDEADVPPLPALPGRSAWGDLVAVFRRPILKRPSRPAEESEGEVEGADGPKGEDHQGDQDRGAAEPRPLEDHEPKGGDQLGQG
jgi:hypothetical protein